MTHRIFLPLAVILSCFLFLGTQSQAQSMDEILKQLADEAVKNQGYQTGNTNDNYAEDLTGANQTYTPLTREQANRLQTQRQLNLLNEILSAPEGETREQRQQRYSDYTDNLRREDEARSQQEREYSNQQMQNLMYGNSGSRSTPNNPSYSSKRQERLNRTQQPPVTRQTSNAKPAGFDPNYKHNFPQSSATPPPAQPAPETSSSAPSGLTVNRSRRRAKRAGNVQEVNTKPPVRTCSCKGADKTVYGIHCVKQGHYVEVPNEKHWADGIVYEIGSYPWTDKCVG